MERKGKRPGNGKGVKRQVVEKRGLEEKMRLEIGEKWDAKVLLIAEAMGKRAEKSRYNEEQTP